MNWKKILLFVLPFFLGAFGSSSIANDNVLPALLYTAILIWVWLLIAEKTTEKEIKGTFWDKQ